jgi:hypothetical protein
MLSGKLGKVTAGTKKPSALPGFYVGIYGSVNVPLSCTKVDLCIDHPSAE